MHLHGNGNNKNSGWMKMSAPLKNLLELWLCSPFMAALAAPLSVQIHKIAEKTPKLEGQTQLKGKMGAGGLTFHA